MTGNLLADELMLPEASEQPQHSMDSSRVLLGLMALSRQAEAAAADPQSDSLGGIISKNVLRSLMSALHYRDVTTVRHVRRVAQLAVGMATYLGWEGRHLKLLEVAALLHDIGKIGVPDNILFKPGKLNTDEVELMALHYNIGVDVLQACCVDREVIEIVGQSQHTGFGNGLQRVGSDLHLGARILAVADAYDSLSTDQVYRDGKPHQEIMKILMDAAGTQFDGNVVCALSRWIEAEGLPFAKSVSENPNGTQGPARPEEALEAASLGNIFSYLYVLESLYDGFYLVDSDLRFVVWNRGAETFLGHSAGHVLGQSWNRKLLGYADVSGAPLADRDCPMNRVIATGKPTIPTVQLQHKDGRWLEVELQTVPLLDGEGRLQGVAEIFRDVSRTARRPREFNELKLAASRDALTQVANRGELETQLAMMVAEFGADEAAEPFSVIFLDVDFFKSINDSHGHAVGDQVLVDLARLMQHETYSGELVARYGGEEFVILCPATLIDQAVRRAERLRVALPQTEIGGLKDRQITASFGVAQIEPGDSVESILRRADKALYMAKQAGRNKTCSLTTAQQMAADAPPAPVETTPVNPFIMHNSFEACLAADMIVYKLGGFVTECGAKLVEVSPKRAVMRLGSAGLLPFWGRSDDRQPIEMELDFGEPHSSSNRKSAMKTVQVDVRIRPLGWIRDPEVFQLRAKRVVKALRAFFAVG